MRGMGRATREEVLYETGPVQDHKQNHRLGDTAVGSSCQRTLKHTDGCSQSWPVVGLCCRWISRRRRREGPTVTLLMELGS